MKVHYPKLYNMAHLLLSLNVFTASKGSNNYTLFIFYSFNFVEFSEISTRNYASSHTQNSDACIRKFYV